MSKFVNPTKVITGVNTRWSYVNAWEPKSINGGTPKYSVVLQIKWNSILQIIRDCFDDVRMNNSRLFDADSALCFI